ncbi:MAG: hypothetical protein J7494_06425 [Sphingobium sp.]|nr:hypothetical protein [Sphingobium sp.]
MASVSDLLFEMTEWLRTTSVLDLALWTDTTSLRNFYQAWFFWIPILQTIHIIAIAVTFGSALMLNCRILGLVGGHRTLPQAMDRYSRVIWWGLLIVIISGINLVISEPIRDLVNPFFWLKMGLVVAIVPLNALFNSAVKRKMAKWESPATGHALVRLGAVAMILVWCAIMAGGRLIAYAPV